MVCKFTKDDGSNLTGDHSTSTPVNNILHSLFTEIDVSLNGKSLPWELTPIPTKPTLRNYSPINPEH